MLESFSVEKAEREAKQRKTTHYRPLDEIIDDGLEPKIAFGLEKLDAILGGGVADGLTMLIGYTHSGKSLLCESAVYHNRDKRIVIVSPDETANMISSKLLERLGINDSGMPKHERSQFIKESYPRLGVCEYRDTHMLEAFMDDYAYVHDGVDLVIYDYLSLLRGREVTEEVQSKAEWMKAFARQWEVPLLCIHQGSRGKSADGQPLTLSSGAYGGEQSAFVVLGVHQPGQNPELRESEKKFFREHPTLVVQVLKNKQKRRGGLSLDGIPYAITTEGLLADPTIYEIMSPSPVEIARHHERKDLA